MTECLTLLVLTLSSISYEVEGAFTLGKQPNSTVETITCHRVESWLLARFILAHPNQCNVDNVVSDINFRLGVPSVSKQYVGNHSI